MCLSEKPKCYLSPLLVLSSVDTTKCQSDKHAMQTALNILTHLFPIHNHIIIVYVLNMLLQKKHAIFSPPSLPTSHVDITFHLERFRNWLKIKKLSHAFSWPNTWNIINFTWSITSHMLFWTTLLQNFLSWYCFHSFRCDTFKKITSRKSVVNTNIIWLISL